MLICKHQIQEIGNIWNKRPIVVSKSVESIQILIVHVIYHQLLVAQFSKENHVAIRMNGELISFINIATHLSKQLQEAHPVLEDPSSCIIVLKNPNGQASPF